MAKGTDYHPGKVIKKDILPQIFSQIVPIRVKKLSNTNFISSRHIKKEKALLAVDIRRSNSPFLSSLLWVGVGGGGGIGIMDRGII